MPPTQLIDAEVHFRAVCGTLFNQKRQLIGIQLFIPSLADISVEKAASEDPFNVPTRPINTLSQFAPQDGSAHRVKVKGVVTLQRADGSFFMQDETGGLYVQTTQKTELQPGESVEALGFPAAVATNSALQDAIFLKSGGGSSPAPTSITTERAMSGDFDNELVQVEGRLMERLNSSAEQESVLQSGSTIFNAHLEGTTGGDGLASLRVGSLVRLTGVCSVQADGSSFGYKPKGFRILLRSPADVVVLETPSWRRSRKPTARRRGASAARVSDS